MRRFKRVHPGDRMEIEADAFNAALDAAEANLDRRHQAALGARPRAQRDRNLVIVKNSTGTKMSQYTPVQLVEPVFQPDSEQTENVEIVMSVEPVIADTLTTRLAVLMQPLPAGEMGPAQITGLAQVYIYIHDETHTMVRPTDSGGLETAASGKFPIVWMEAGTGADKWAIIMLGVVPIPACLEPPAVLVWDSDGMRWQAIAENYHTIWRSGDTITTGPLAASDD